MKQASVQENTQSQQQLPSTEPESLVVSLTERVKTLEAECVIVQDLVDENR